MSFVTEVAKTVTDTTPVYAVVGATDVAVEKVREARVRAVAVRAELAPDVLTHKVAKRANKVAEQAQQAPAFALNRTLEIAGKAQESYDNLADRGEKLVHRLRDQKATKDLLDQAGNTVSLGKGAVTTARRAANDTQRAAKATLTTGRREAAKVVDTLMDTVERDADIVADQVRESAAKTRTSAKRTSTTAKKRAARTTTASKAASTSARKTTAATRKATAASTAKVGD